MNKKNILIASTLFVSTGALADINDLYLQGEINPLHKINSTSSKTKNLPYRISGGYDFAHIDDWTFGAELGYLNWYRSQNKSNLYYQGGLLNLWNNTLKQQGGDLLLVTDYRLGRNFHIVGKGGLAVLKESEKSSSFGNVYHKISTTKAHPEIAAGIGYDLTDNLNLNITGNHIVSNGTNLLVGLKVKF